MAAVYEAEHLTLGRRVAIKVIRPEYAGEASYRERFLRETRLAASVRHPGVVTVYDAADSNGTLWMAMDFLPDGDLARWVRHPSPLGEVEVLRLGLRMAEALAAIHDAGLLHRDLKPDNILMDAHGQPLISDLGLARLQTGDDRLTSSGQVFGTPAYMSPEQAAGRPDLDVRCDVYGLAATIFALMAGQPPFAGSSPWATVAQVLHEDPPPLRRLRPDASRGLESLLRRAMAKDPEARPANARVLAQELASLHDTHTSLPTVTAATPTTGPMTWLRSRPVQVAIMLGGVTALLLLIAAIAASGDRSAAPEPSPAMQSSSSAVTSARRSGTSPKAGGLARRDENESSKVADAEPSQPIVEAWGGLRGGLRGSWEVVPYDLSQLHRAIRAAADRQNWPLHRDEADDKLLRVEGDIPGSGSWRIMARPTDDGAIEMRITCGIIHNSSRAERVAQALEQELR